MSDLKKKVLRYLKGAGAGSMLISIVVHSLVIGGATVYVIHTVAPPKKANFAGGGGNNAPSAVQRPVKMSNTQPKLESLSKRLSVESSSSSVSLPDLPTGQAGGIGGPSLTGSLGGPGVGTGTGPKGPVMPAFGFREAPKAGGTLVGRFYDLKQYRTKKPNPNLAKIGPARLAINEVTSFIKAGWSSSALAEFFVAPTALYATQIFVPVMSANEAPKAYGVEKEVKPMAWIAHYKGKVSPPANGVYRFVGAGDDLMAVRIDGRLVLDCGGSMGSTFKSERSKNATYKYAYKQNKWNVDTRGGFVVGHRMELRAGLFYDIDIVFSEGPGGLFCAMLLFEQEGVTYKKDGDGHPILPIFRVADSKTEPSETGPRFDADGPIWRALPAPKN